MAARKLKGQSAVELAKMPDHSNEHVKKTEDRLGRFIFDSDSDSESDSFSVETKGPFELENGVIYHG